ncbi:piggyBac transposable element-derived protein 4-like [Chanodichthys erythropterus]|uniref:piggyBac transposable element-derived protein 4-like n=1 Tax=Chanodichthys erythropterus TaxID=933992 RepID=UPI00351F4BB4
MAKRYTLHETVEFLLDSSENENLEDSEPEDSEPEDCNPPEEEDEDNQESEDDFEEADADQTLISKNGQITWSTIPPPQRPGRSPAAQVIKLTPGPTRYACSRVEDIKSSFLLFFPSCIQSILVEMTNLEGRRVYGADWRDVDWTDMETYIGLILLAGVYRSKNENLESLWDAQTGRAIFGAVMPLKKFKIFSRVIRFDDKATRPARRENDKLAPIRDLWNSWVERLPMMFNPGPNITVDECLVSFRGRCMFKQYMPNKPAKYGIKIWAACDAKTSYAWSMQIYTGKPRDGPPERNQGMRVVLDLTTGLQGHTVTCDNFFTSYALGQELLKRKMTMVGTVRRNKPELPSALLTTRDRAVHSSLFAFTETHSLVSYCPKRHRNVLLMSTCHKDAKISDREDRKPEVILDYNRCKGGVDNLDKMVASYSCKRKTNRWPMVVFSTILDVSAINAFVVWREINPSWERGKSTQRRIFLEQLGKALVSPLMERRQHLPRAPASASILKRQWDSSNAPGPSTEPQPKRTRCQVCPRAKDAKTDKQCVICKRAICAAHTVFFCQKCVE